MELKERTGSSKHSIVQYLEANGHELVNIAVNAALAKGKEAGVLDTARGHGGSYIITPTTRVVLKKKSAAGKFKSYVGRFVCVCQFIGSLYHWEKRCQSDRLNCHSPT